MRIFLIGLLFLVAGCQDVRIRTIDKKLILKTGDNMGGMFVLNKEVRNRHNLKNRCQYEILEMREVNIVKRVEPKN